MVRGCEVAPSGSGKYDARVEEQRALDLVYGLAGRLCREAPFDGGAAELCGRLALLGGAQGLALFSVEAEAGRAALLGSYGLPVDYPRRFPPREARPLGHLPGDLREALQRGEPLVVDGIDADPRTVSLTSVALLGHFTSTLSVPLLLDGRALGLIHAFYVPDPSAERRRLLIRAAPLLAMALTTDRLRTAVERLQGGPPGPAEPRLYEITQIHRQLDHVHAAAERYGFGYSVVVYAIDHAARIRRRYGEWLVEQAMRVLGDLTLAECRTADYAGRLSPAECLVVMPVTTERGAFSQAERVLQRFARAVFRHGDRRLTLSASAGISTFPASGALDGRAGIRAARAALETAVDSEGGRTIAVAAVGSAAPSPDE